jgi:ELWxxDGT repeat protein
MPAGNLFYWMIVKPGTGNVLWKSDGRVAGTEELKIMGSSANNNYPQNIAIGNNLFFAGLDNVGGKELWVTDGTAAGTYIVADINPVLQSHQFRFLK